MDPTGTQLVPMLVGDHSQAYIVKGVRIGADTNRFFARVELD